MPPPPLPKRRPPVPRRRFDQRGINALLGWELMRVSRRIGSLAAGRFFFGGALLVVLWVLWSSYFSQIQIVSGDATEIQRELSKFAGMFSRTFFIVQLIIALLLTPIYVAGSVFEERETRSGEVLLTTDLTRKEIFFGKLWARVFQVLFVVAAGMPILSLTLLWGGISIEFIIIGYLTTFISVVSAGAIAAAVSADSETMRGAILGTYGYVVVLDGMLIIPTPFAVIMAAAESTAGGIGLGVMFLMVQLCVIIFALRYGLRWLRLAMLRQRRRVTDVLANDISRRKSPINESNPLLWKELNVADKGDTFSEFARTAKWWVMGYAFFIVLLMLGGVMPSGWITRYASLIALGAVIAAVGIGAAGSVARERQKNTLIDLFMIPGGRREILQAKLWAALQRGKWGLLVVFGLVCIGVFTGSSLFGVPLLILAGLGYTYFAATLGIWFSVRSKSALVATAGWTGVVALFLIGTYLVADAGSSWKQEQGQIPVTIYPSWAWVINPAMAWTKLGMPPDIDFRSPTIQQISRGPERIDLMELALAFCSILLYSGLGYFLWKRALRIFQQEGREAG